MLATNVSPGLTDTIGPRAPLISTSPARSGVPISTILSANQTAAFNGFPRHAAPSPVDTCTPARAIVITQPVRSISRNGTGLEPSTNRPLDALSATVSSNRMSQFAIRLPTISIAATAYAVEDMMSANVCLSCVRSRPSTNAISASTLGFRDAQHGMVVGAYGMAFQTNDGGRTWQSMMGRLDAGDGRHLYAVLVNRGVVYLFGEQGTVLASNDRGATFRRVPFPGKGTIFGAVSANGVLLTDQVPSRYGDSAGIHVPLEHAGGAGAPPGVVLLSLSATAGEREGRRRSGGAPCRV